MLNHLRESSHGFFGKMLLALLVLLFVVWGIGDIFRSSGGAAISVATVGRTDISLQEYGRALHQKQEELQARFGKAYTPELMEKLGLNMMVRNELINDQLVSEEANALGIVVSDADLVKEISKNPAFQDKNGNFDKVLYLATLKSHGFTEQRYVDDLRKQLATTLLVNTINLSAVPSDVALALYKSREEQRVVDLYVISKSQVKQAAEPTDKETETYYHDNSRLFLTPEYRTVSFIDFKIADAAAKTEVSEDEIKHNYDDRIQDFMKPERRELHQLLFNKEADANAAADKLEKGIRLSNVVESSPITNKDKVSLGVISKQELPTDFAEQVFTLKEGTSTKPLKYESGWTIFYVNKIVPQSTQTLAEVHKDIAKELSTAKAADYLSQLSAKVEDDMAGGMSLEDVAKKNGYTVQTITKISHDGKTADGKITSLPTYDNFLNVVFSAQEKEHSSMTQASDGSFFIVQVDKIDAEHTRPLDEVKDTIVTYLKSQATEKLIMEAANDAAAKLRAGKKPDIELNAISSGNIKRSSTQTHDGTIKLPRDFMREVFEQTPHSYTLAYPSEPNKYIIGSVSKEIPAPTTPDAKALEDITDEQKGTLKNAMLGDYLAYLQTQHPVKINDAVFHAKGQEDSE